MALYIGNSSSVAKKMKKLYVGVNGVARKVKKLYVGVAGIARKVFGGLSSATRMGTLTNLATNRRDMAYTSIDNYGIIGGGYGGGGYIKTVEYYNANLTKGTAESLTSGAEGARAVAVNNYAIIAGGMPSSSSASSQAHSYDTSLTHSTLSGLTGSYRAYMGAATIGQYGLFAGGGWGKTRCTNAATAYDSQLTRVTVDSLVYSKYDAVSSSNNNYAVVSGAGSNTITSTYVDSYNISLTKGVPSSLTTGEKSWAGTAGEYIMFGGGSSGKTTVEYYGISLTKGSFERSVNVSGGYNDCSCITIDGFCFIFGGRGPNTNADMYDESLTRLQLTNLNPGHDKPAVVTVQDYIIIAGGSNDWTTINTAQYYQYN